MKKTLLNAMSYILLVTMLTLLFSSTAVNAAANTDTGGLNPVLTVTNLFKDGKGDYEIGSGGKIVYKIDITNTSATSQTNVVVKGGVPAGTSLKFDTQTLLDIGTAALSKGVLDVNDPVLMLIGTKAGVNIKDITQSELWDILYDALAKCNSGLMSIRDFITEPLLWNVGTIAGGATVSITYTVYLNEGTDIGSVITNDIAVYSDTSMQVMSNKVNIVVPLTDSRVPLENVTDIKNPPELEPIDVDSLEKENNILSYSFRDRPVYASLNVNPFMAAASVNLDERAFNVKSAIPPTDESVVSALNAITVSRDVVLAANASTDEDNAAGPEDDDIMSIFDTPNITVDETDDWSTDVTADANSDTAKTTVDSTNTPVDPVLQITPYEATDVGLTDTVTDSADIFVSADDGSHNTTTNSQAKSQDSQARPVTVDIAPNTGTGSMAVYVIMLLASMGAAGFMIMRRKPQNKGSKTTK